MRAIDGKIISNATAEVAQADTFKLAGGKYAVTAKATWGGGSAKLQILLGDGSTYVSVATGSDFTADGFAAVDLPPGAYRFTCATASAIYLNVVRIPGE
jgi:hypothetical protein